MESILLDGPQPKGKKGQNTVVNEQEQQERVNPGGEDFESTQRKNQENPDNSLVKRNLPGLEEGNNYEDNHQRGDTKMP